MLPTTFYGNQKQPLILECLISCMIKHLVFCFHPAACDMEVWYSREIQQIMSILDVFRNVTIAS